MKTIINIDILKYLPVIAVFLTAMNVLLLHSILLTIIIAVIIAIAFCSFCATAVAIAVAFILIALWKGVKYLSS